MADALEHDEPYRAVLDDPVVATFVRELGFAPDAFQLRAIAALLRGRSVLVAAPTGAGKTVVGEFACHEALHAGGKCFYTTPIKALSNQKFRDLVERYGEDRVGLLTGDRSVNGEAPVVVMTTEVLRNMIYEASPTLRELRHVVLDEVHYLADRSRGAVWEEVIVQLPASVQLAALSATVSNAEEFGRWLDRVRDHGEVVIEEHRPVPLRHHYFVNDKVYDTFRAGRKGGASREHRERAAQALAGVPNPDVVMLERRARTRNRVSNKGRRMGPDVKLRWPSRPHVIEELAHRGWLPAIVFVFSRQGCEDAVAQLLQAGVRLTDRAERDEIAATVDTMLGDLPDADLRVLGFDRWRAGLLDGIAAHHAGMVPAFKEAVEVLFQRGLLKVVVATETLALGINMPARTVVIERLEKWNGESHVLLTPGEYTQLTGRAGRRGIDSVGHAVVLYQRDLDFPTVAGLVGTRTYPLRSSFAPSYNMAVNLLRRHDLVQAEALLGASFAQFEADESVLRSAERLTELEEALAGYAGHLRCELGDWDDYWHLRRSLSRLEKREAKERRRDAEDQVRAGIAALQPGDVLHLPWTGRRGLVAVVGVQFTKKGTPLLQVVSDDRALSKVGPRELDAPPVPVERIRLPRKGNPRQKDYRRDIAMLLRGLEPPTLDDAVPPATRGAVDAGPSEEVRELRAQVRAHACHACPDRAEHERWQYRADDLQDQAAGLRRSIERATGSLVRQLHRILRVLTHLGYLVEDDAGIRPTDEGLRLAGIYSEVDLLVAEAVRRGVLDELDPAELAGIAALFLYEPRGGEPTERPELPTLALYDTVDELQELAEELRRHERDAGVRPLRDLDAGFVAAAYRWASGDDLDEALGSLQLTGGDFVRNVKQVADLVGQLRSVGGQPLSGTAAEAVDALRRGIVEA
ncbi:DEAD/DEAH box helicase [Egicoccus halophilus]|uniref:Helicase n=1 Tax=Egicoccus halophilus TaxID=1670830 RepID=A0A8J3A8J5_9ACTN|nr:DEAD/DEAH box helicase [Egicoccus halophilus]GGI04699.1 helicase [Egicoccus halophilus]